MALGKELPLMPLTYAEFFAGEATMHEKITGIINTALEES